MVLREASSLLELFAEFKEKQPEGTIETFGRWLVARENPRATVLGEDVAKETTDFSGYIKERAPNQQLGILIGRLYRFARFYVKKNLGHLHLSLDEFGFLAGTLQLGQPTKSELISMNLAEPTSGTDIIRRLMKLGYIEEADNKDDKRSKRLFVTPLGRETLMTCFQLMNRMAHLLAAQLTDEELDRLIHSLTYLNDFHTQIHTTHRDMALEELIDTFVGK